MSEELIFAVGDIHGRFDLVQAALEAIFARVGGSHYRIICLGDYIDRGPASRGVVELMLELSSDPRVVCLKGNHEAMMLRSLASGNSDDFGGWMEAGGEATIASYGADDWSSAVAQAPADHLRWMAGLPLTSGDGHRIYVHAGLLPATSFERQTEEACLWIRERFLRAPAHQFDSHIVHGHTPSWAGNPTPGEPELLSHRTNLDLGAYMTDRLGVGVFDGEIAGGPVEMLVITQRPGEPASVSALTPPKTSLPIEAADGRRRWARSRTWLR